MKYGSLMVDVGGARSYPIEIFSGNLNQIGSSFGAIFSGYNALIVTNAVVGRYYLSALQDGLSEKFQNIFHISLKDGENQKNWSSLNEIYDALIRNKCDRNTWIFALGGGVVGDLRLQPLCEGFHLCRCLPRCWLKWILQSVGKRQLTIPWEKI